LKVEKDLLWKIPQESRTEEDEAAPPINQAINLNQRSKKAKENQFGF